MQITIEQVTHAAPGATRVQFCSDAGHAAAHWDGSLPVPGEDYEVDLALPGVLEWGQAIAPTSLAPGKLFAQGDLVCLSGRLLQVRDDSVCQLMFRDDILLLDVCGEQPAGLAVPGNVLVRVPYIKVFEMDF